MFCSSSWGKRVEYNTCRVADGKVHWQAGNLYSERILSDSVVWKYCAVMRESGVECLC